MLNPPSCIKDCPFLKQSEESVVAYKEMHLALAKQYNEVLKENIELRSAQGIAKSSAQQTATRIAESGEIDNGNLPPLDPNGVRKIRLPFVRNPGHSIEEK